MTLYGAHLGRSVQQRHPQKDGNCQCPSGSATLPFVAFFFSLAPFTPGLGANEKVCLLNSGSEAKALNTYLPFKAFFVEEESSYQGGGPWAFCACSFWTKAPSRRHSHQFSSPKGLAGSPACSQWAPEMWSPLDAQSFWCSTVEHAESCLSLHALVFSPAIPRRQCGTHSGCRGHAGLLPLAPVILCQLQSPSFCFLFTAH